MPDWFWTIFHLYWAFITIVICWQWWARPPSFSRSSMLALGIAALISNALFIYTDFSPVPT